MVSCSSFASRNQNFVVEVCLKPTSTAKADKVEQAVRELIHKREAILRDGPIDVKSNTFLAENVEFARIVDTGL